MKKQKRAGSGIVLGSALILLAQIVAFCGYRIGMHRAQTALAATGTDNPGAISHNIDAVLYSLVVGCVGTLIGLVIIVRALIAIRRAQRDVA